MTLTRLRSSAVPAIVLAILPLIFAARAQTIRLPDFRQTPLYSEAPVPGEPCDECGVVRSIREINKRRTPVFDNSSSVRSTPYDTRVVGALVVLPFGAGSGSTSAYAGGVGTPEMSARLGELSYQVTLRMDDGSYRSMDQIDGNRYSVGDRVRVVDQRLQLLPVR
jgi:hypothetical protein